MKQILLLIICILPILAPAQEIKNYTEEDILNDKDFIALQSEIQPIEDKLEAIITEFQQATQAKRNDPAFQAEIAQRYSAAMSEMVSLLRTFISNHPNSYISLITLNELMGFNSGIEVSDLLAMYNSLSDLVKRTDFGEALGTRIRSVALTAIGAVAPDFTQNDPSGKPVRLSDFRGKYVLVDFWASWCRPCREENPNVVRAYTQFKNKNFEILGVSLDNPNARSSWLRAVETDQLTWTQVSDLQGWRNEAARLYGVESIPQNFLIDPRGVIVAKNLRGEELIRTLDRILN